MFHHSLRYCVFAFEKVFGESCPWRSGETAANVRLQGGKSERRVGPPGEQGD